MRQNKVKSMVFMALMLALSFAGSSIKLPGVFSTIAFDSFPAYFAGLILGGVPGGLIGALGHLMTSMLSGFPFGPVIHGIIAVMMFVSVYVFAKVCHAVNGYVGIVTGVLINGILMPAVLAFVPGFSWPMAVSFMLPLSAASAANIIMAKAIEKLTGKVIKEGFSANGV